MSNPIALVLTIDNRGFLQALDESSSGLAGFGDDAAKQLAPASKEVQRLTRAVRAALKALEALPAALTKLNEGAQPIQQLGDSADAAAKGVRDLANQVKTTDEVFEDAEKAARDFNDALKKAADDGADELGDEVKDTRQEVDKLGDSSEKAGAAVKAGLGVAAAAATAAVAAVVGLTAAVLELSQRGDEVAKLGSSFGTTAEDVQRLSGALELGGVEFDRARQSIIRYQTVLGEARVGQGEASQSLRDLGLEADALADLPLVEQFALISDEVSEFSSQADRARVISDLFGRSGVLLLSAIDEGGDAFRDAADEIERYGILSDQTAANSERLRDAVSLLQRSGRALIDSFLAPLIPLFASTAQAAADFLVAFRTDADRTTSAAQFLSDTLRNVVIPAVGALGLVGLQVFSSIKTSIAGVRTFIQLLALEAEQAFQTLTLQLRRARETEREQQAIRQGYQEELRDLAAVQEANAQAVGEFVSSATTVEQAAPVFDDLAESQRLVGVETDKANEALAQQAQLLELTTTKAQEFAAAERTRLVETAALEQALREKRAEFEQAELDRLSEAQRAQAELAQSAADAAAASAQILSETVGFFNTVTQTQLESLAGIVDEQTQAIVGGISESVAALSAAIQDGITNGTENSTESILAITSTALGALSTIIGQSVDERLAAAETAASRELELNEQIANATSERERDSLTLRRNVLRQRRRAENQAAVDAFRAQKAVAIAQAAIGASLAIIQAFAQLGPIAGTVAAIAVGITTGIQVAAIAAQQPPQIAHSGGTVLPAGGGLQRDERLVRAMVGERVVTQAAVERAGGEEVFDRLEAGGTLGPQLAVVQQDVDGARIIDERIAIISRSNPSGPVGTGRPSVGRAPSRWSTA